MVGFTIPESTYLSVYYDGPHPMDPDPYETLANYRQVNRIEVNGKGMVLEKYRFGKEFVAGEKIALEVFGPIIEKVN